MKKIGVSAIFLLIIFCVNIYLGYCQAPLDAAAIETKAVDVNKDGKPDVTYYSDGKYATKVEADTNYDGKPDITIKTKDGKFESAEVDTNYDGKTDKKFTDSKEFSNWLNENNAAFKDQLDRANWEFALISF
jgi:hypothetical protein